MKYKLFLTKYYYQIVFGTQILLYFVVQKSIAFAEYRVEITDVPEDLTWIDYPFNNEKHYESIQNRPTLVEPKVIWSQSIYQEMNGAIDPNTTAEPIKESTTIMPPVLENQNTVTPEPIQNNDDIQQEFILDISKLAASLEMHLKRAGDNKFLIVQASERALNSFYPNINPEEANMLLQNIEGLNLSDFGSKETMSHLMTNIAIKSRGGSLPTNEVQLQAYQKAYARSLAYITKTFY